MRELRDCPCCGAGVEIKVFLREYGFCGVVIECPNCHCSIRNGKCFEQIRREERFATPITQDSLAKCLFDTIRMWNSRSKRANADIADLGLETDADAWERKHWEGAGDGN